MAINPGYKQFTFDGESSGNYGVYITGQAVYNSPKRDVELIEIPGRNGAFVLDNGRFENIEVTYPAGIYAESQEEFAQAISDLRNMLASRKGYCRLTDEYNPEEYRMAVYKSGLDVDPVAFQRAGEFSITFDCKPQRWLTSGEVPVTIGEWGETETVSGDIVSVENPNGILAVKSLEVDLEPIQDLHGYDAPWVGGAGKNKLDIDSVTTSASANWGVSVSGNTLTVEHKNTYSTGLPRTADMALTAGTYCISYTPSISIVVDVYVNGSWFKAVNTGGTFTLSADSTVYVAFPNTQATTITYQNVQLESGSTPTSYAPYENICPISGHTDVVVSRTGKNLLDPSITHQYSIYWAFGSSGTGSNVPDGTLVLNAGTYTFSTDTVSTVISVRTSETTEIERANNATSATFTLSKRTAIKIGVTSNNSPTKFQLELGSPATTFEPYQGDTYTTALGTTVYGGTLDVATGVLTVTHGIVDFGDLNWVYSSGQNSYFYSSAISDFKFIDNNAVNYICSAYESYSVNERYKNGYIFINSGKSAIVMNTNYTNASTFKTDMTGQKIVYELATATTVQLTAQQIDLLTGDNNIWSDSGDITLEYGQNPSVLVNPTLFESSPLLEATGSGTIEFNGYEIEFAGVPYGEVVIAESRTEKLPIQTGTPTGIYQNLDTSLLNIGDRIYPETKECVIIVRLRLQTSGDFMDVSIGSTTNVLEAKTAIVPGEGGAIEQYLDLYLYPDFGDGFVYDTIEQIVCTAEYNYRIRGQSTVWTETVQVTLDYTVTNYLIDVRSTGAHDYNVGLNRCWITAPTTYGNSSKLVSVPIFIDCDLGEAYIVENGVYRSLNQFIDLGSELPKLGVGETEVTFDNTITELKVTPRWWKV